VSFPLVAGLDIGQIGDPSAFVVLELTRKRLVRSQEWGPKQEPPPGIDLRHVERLQMLGEDKRPIDILEYPDQVDLIFDRMMRPALRGKCELVVDATGVGKPVLDFFRRKIRDELVKHRLNFSIPIVPVMITTGTTVSFDKKTGCWHVPKRDIVQALQVLFQERRIRYAKKMAFRREFEKEVKNFKVEIDKITMHDTYEGRKGAHDDIVLAVAIAVWWAMRSARGMNARPEIKGEGRRFTVREIPFADTKEYWERGDPPPMRRRKLR
jgi:hypothetical protein